MKRLFLVVPALALALVLWSAGCASDPPPDRPSGGGPSAGGPGPQPAGGPSAGGPAPSGPGPGPGASGPQPEPTTPWEVTEETEETHKKGEATEEVR